MNYKYLPSVKILYYLGNTEKIITTAAKATLSPKDFTNIMENMRNEDIENWIQELIGRGHGSPLEHSIYVFEVTCSRVCSHQLVRHRHASYSQLSQRYSDKYLRGLINKACSILSCEYKESFEHYINVLTKLIESIDDFNTLLDITSETFIIPPTIINRKNNGFLKALLNSTIKYYEALLNNTPYEDARYILPQAIKTRIIVSMNARELIEVFLPLRMCSRAQWEIRLVAWNLWRQLIQIHPFLFQYTGPRCVFQENRTRHKPCKLIEYIEGKCCFTITRCPEKIPQEQIHECLLKAHNETLYI